MDGHTERLEYEVATPTGKVARTGMLVFRKAEDSPDGVANWERTSLLGGSNQRITFHRAELQALARAALIDAHRRPDEPWAVAANRVAAALEGLIPSTREEDIEEAQLDARLRAAKVTVYAQRSLDGLLARYVMSAHPRAPGLPSVDVNDYTALADSAFAAGEAMMRKEEILAARRERLLGKTATDTVVNPALAQAVAAQEARPETPRGSGGEVLFTGPPAALRTSEETAIRSLMHLGWHIIGPDIPGQVNAIVRHGPDRALAECFYGLENLRALERPISADAPMVLAAVLKWYDSKPFLFEIPTNEAIDELYQAVKMWAGRDSLAEATPEAKAGEWLVLPGSARYTAVGPPEKVKALEQHKLATVFDALCVSHPDTPELAMLVAEDSGGLQLARRVCDALNQADRRQASARAPAGSSQPDGGLTEAIAESFGGVRWCAVGVRSSFGGPPQLTLQPIACAGERLDAARLAELTKDLVESARLMRLIVVEVASA